MVWNKEGIPLYNAVVWQCRRSIAICERLKEEGIEDLIRRKTGLIADPYFSGTKLIWLYENIDDIKRAVDEGNACFGTIDTWLLYKLTKGKSYFTDYTNASRTLFFNLQELDWDRALLKVFGLSGIHLPEPKPSSFLFGETNFNGLTDAPVAITGMIGDSHAAAFGEGCFSPGAAKITMGTGCSILMNIGKEAKVSHSGMVTTICWSIEGRVDYAFEGIIVSCGSIIEWLKNETGLINSSEATEAMAAAVADNNGVYLIPAFNGLGAPHWDMKRKASISGLTFNCNQNHIVRAALESICYQIKDVIVAMERDGGIKLEGVMANGGISSNGFVLQLLADLLEKKIQCAGMPDVSALGAAYIAGWKAGIYKDLEALKALNNHKISIQPSPENDAVKSWYEVWKELIRSGI